MEIENIDIEKLKIIGKKLDENSGYNLKILEKHPEYVISYMIGYVGSSLGISEEIDKVSSN